MFQPAEEESRGGKALIDKGLLELAPRPDFAFAQHGWVGVPVGAVSAAPGPMMAAADSFLITITGRGGHAGHAPPNRGSRSRRPPRSSPPFRASCRAAWIRSPRRALAVPDRGRAREQRHPRHGCHRGHHPLLRSILEGIHCVRPWSASSPGCAPRRGAPTRFTTTRVHSVGKRRRSGETCPRRP